jgi:cytochrome c biogenesis protein CcdA
MFALGVGLLLGLRHSTDPDHLTAVSTLVMSEDDRSAGAAGRLGAAWGLGHACTLLVLGIPVVVFGDFVPAGVQTGLEAAVGVVIVALAVRLLVRWRRGYLHVHVHSHGDEVHAHPHVHEGPGHGAHEHRHELGRSPLASFGIGLVHGAGGSAGVGVLVVATMPTTAERIAALTALALGTATAMATMSAAFGYALARGPLVRRFEQAAPVLGTLSLAFGVWYGLAAL